MALSARAVVNLRFRATRCSPSHRRASCSPRDRLVPLANTRRAVAGGSCLPRRWPASPARGPRMLRDQPRQGLSMLARFRNHDDAGARALGAVRTDQRGGVPVETVDKIERRVTPESHRGGKASRQVHTRSGSCRGCGPRRRPTSTGSPAGRTSLSVLPDQECTSGSARRASRGRPTPPTHPGPRQDCHVGAATCGSVV
ncbi:hypothetical protein GALL_316540 [mine drainage metagenome]|uniref:Uncharacterized protein n=1 Tax=mine drainage metagenome TaxID=410659 RepID=A0A1J5QS98_9ZZZZ